MNTISQKQCTKCGETKPVSEFNKDNRAYSGYQSACRDCQNSQKREIYSRNPEAARQTSRDWRLNRSPERRQRDLDLAKKWKEEHPELITQHRKNRYWKYRDYLLELRKLWRKLNPEKAAARAKLDWQKRRANKLNAPGDGVSAEDWRAICDMYGNQCLCCGHDNVSLTQDHVKPLSRGGADDISNIQPLCRQCNAAKGAREIDYR